MITVTAELRAFAAKRRKISLKRPVLTAIIAAVRKVMLEPCTAVDRINFFECRENEILVTEMQATQSGER